MTYSIFNRKECAKWEETYGEKATPEAETMHDKISGIKKSLTATMPASLTETELKVRDNRPYLLSFIFS